MDEQPEPGSDIDLLMKLQNQPLDGGEDAGAFVDESQNGNAVVTESVGQLGTGVVLGGSLAAIQGYSEDSSSQDAGDELEQFAQISEQPKPDDLQEREDPVNLLPEEPIQYPEIDELSQEPLQNPEENDNLVDEGHEATYAASLEAISEASNDGEFASNTGTGYPPAVEAISDVSNDALVSTGNQDAPDGLADEEPMEVDTTQTEQDVDVNAVIRDISELNEIAGPPVSHTPEPEVMNMDTEETTAGTAQFGEDFPQAVLDNDESSTQDKQISEQDDIQPGLDEVDEPQAVDDVSMTANEESPLVDEEMQPVCEESEPVDEEPVQETSPVIEADHRDDEESLPANEENQSAEENLAVEEESQIVDDQVQPVDADIQQADEGIMAADDEGSHLEPEGSHPEVAQVEDEASAEVVDTQEAADEDEVSQAEVIPHSEDGEASNADQEPLNEAETITDSADKAEVSASGEDAPLEDSADKTEDSKPDEDGTREEVEKSAETEDSTSQDVKDENDLTGDKGDDSAEAETAATDVTEATGEDRSDDGEMSLQIGSVQGSAPDKSLDVDDDVTVIGEEQTDVKRTREKSTDSIEGSTTSVDSANDKSKDAKQSAKSPHTCIVCKKVGRCKYNIVRNGNTKHLCDDACFSKFRSTPTIYLRSEDNTSKKDDAGDDDVEIVGTSRLPTKTKATKTSVGTTPSGKTPAAVLTAGKGTTPGVIRQIICTVCKQKKPIKHEVSFNRKMHSLCSDKCFAAFRYANKLTMSPCDNCGAFCNEPSAPGSTTETIQFEGVTKKFCGVICLHSFRSKKKKMTQCSWCNTKKANFEMVERLDTNNKVQLFCTLNCLSLYRVNLQATSNQQVKCDQCLKNSPAQYHLTMSDASVRNFCSYPCVIAFQGQFSQPGGKPGQKKADGSELSITSPASANSATRSTRQSARVAARQGSDEIPIISDVVSLADKVNEPIQASPPVKIGSGGGAGAGAGSGAQTTHIIIQPPKPKQVKNKSLLCKPYTQTKATSCRPHTQSKGTQTDGEPEKKSVLVPVPVPIYIPTPMAMYAAPQPYPIPIPIPIPVPCFIPTTKKSADSILRQIKEIQERMPADPFEAELLMMAEAVATADKSDSDSSTEEEEDHDAPLHDEMKYAPETEATTPVSAPTELGEDMLQMALRMASEISEEPVLDLEDSLNPTPIQPMSHEEGSDFSTIDQSSEILSNSPRDTPRGRRGRPRGRGRGRAKRPRYSEEPVNQQPEPVAPDNRPAADADMVLKYTYGVNAWKHWVVQKNAMLEKASSSRRLKLFKADILACTAEELNFSLCLFVKEVRKPNGEVYAPDSIFYLCLGIQQYLYENGRIDDIFSNSYYEGYTDALNEVLAGYEIRLNAHGLLVCRIEEEHLWESKQLGAHSPYILLNTLIYFNTKYFFLKSPEEHLKLSFSHIMKHWKRANGQPITGKAPVQGGAKNVYLRYYAPTPGGTAESGQKRKREEAPVFEQAENTDNPLRCPVKLYEFYLSKCPESIKHRNDVFYLVPERSCVPDSPVWYSTAALGIEVMSKMLNRLRLVREIQEAHLHSTPIQYSMH